MEICRALRSAHFIGLQSTSDRTEPEEDSPVYTTRADKFRVYRFPWRQGSLFPSKHSGGSDCRPREYLPASQRQTHLHATCTAGRTRRGTEAGPRRRGFFEPPSPSNLREKQLSEKIWKWARRVLDETPSRVVPVLLLDANGHISQTTWPEQAGKYCSKKTTIQRSVLGRTVAGSPFAGGEHFFFPWERLSLDPSPILRLTLRVFQLLFMFTDVAHYTTTEIDCNWQQPSGRRDHRTIQCVFQHQLIYGMHEKRQDHQWDKNKLTQGALFAQDRTTFLSRVEEACRHDEDWTHLAVTDFWAKLNQVLVDAGSDLYAREIQAKIPTPQDTLDARHDMTKAKLDVMRLPPRRPRNQIRDSDLPSDIEWVRHIFTGWRTCLTYWRSTATVRRLQRRDKTKKHTEQAQRISDAWDQRDFRTLWSAARVMLFHRNEGDMTFP